MSGVLPSEKLVNRNVQLKRIADENFLWDVLVIGGGATGLGIALDAVSRGYKTLLVEQADFAKGTSSRSTKLIHGGVRYLAQGNIRLVREASIERGLLYRNAPHLVKNQTFIIPVYSYLEKLKYYLGLKIYDWIAGKLSLGSSVFLPRKKTIEALAGVETKNLIGGILYHDGQFDDARLAVNLMQTIIENGGCAINYMKVTALLKNKEQKIAGVVIEDIESGMAHQIKAKAVVNATGVFVDDILKMDNAAAGKTIRFSQGVHLVFDKKFFPSDVALMIPKTSDGRVLFAVPWHDKVVVGTTDTPIDKASIEPKALEKEIDFIIETASTYLTPKPTRNDALSVFTGLRPLAAPKHHHQKTKKISRSHQINVSSSNLFTMLGGKWTTYRKMGEDMMIFLEKHFQWKPTKSKTATLHIHGYVQNSNQNSPFSFYGSDALLISQKINDSNDWLSESLKIHRAQILWAVENEMARTVEDVLARRARALFLDAKESIGICAEVAKIMAGVLGKDERWIEKEITNFIKLAQNYILEKNQS